MSKSFACFDIDGTLIRWQLYHALADALASKGYIEQEAYKDMRDARMAWKKRTGSSFREYELKVIEVYENILQTLTTTQLDEVIEGVFEEYKDQVYTYTRDLLNHLKANGYTLLAISGSQLEIVELICKYYGFNDWVGTTYKRRGDGFSGTKTIGSHNKSQTLKDMIKKHSLSLKDSIAIGDSLSDATMLEIVEQPIAFNPDKALFDHASNAGWKIVIERKNMIYELEKVNGQYQLA